MYINLINEFIFMSEITCCSCPILLFNKTIVMSFFANVCYEEVTSSLVFAAYESLFGTLFIAEKESYFDSCPTSGVTTRPPPS